MRCAAKSATSGRQRGNVANAAEASRRRPGMPDWQSLGAWPWPGTTPEILISGQRLEARKASVFAHHVPLLAADVLTDPLTRSTEMERTQRDAEDSGRSRAQVGETGRDPRDHGDVRRGAHNPEVAGSNPAPATSKCRSEA